MGLQKGQSDCRLRSYGLPREHSTQNEWLPCLHKVPIPELKMEALPLYSRTCNSLSDSGTMKAMVYVYSNAKRRLYTVSGSVLELISLKEEH